MKWVMMVKKEQIKKIAATALVAFSVTLMPVPAMAVSTNVVSETKNKTTLTMSQIQDLAVIYNRNNQSNDLQKKMLDLTAQTTGNNKRNLQDSINVGSHTMGQGTDESVAEFKQMLDDLANKISTGGGDPMQDAGYVALSLQYESLLASSDSGYTQQIASVESAISQIESINDALDEIQDQNDDLKKTVSDWQKEVRLVAEKLCLSYVQLEKSIALTQEQVALAEKSLNVAQVQERMGMAITTDVPAAQTKLLEAQNSLADLEESLTTIKRQINTLIGRNVGSPLEITNIVKPPTTIQPAPAYTDALIKKFTDANYTLKTLERTKSNAKESVKNSTDSDKRQEVDNTVAATELQITNQKDTIANNLKSLLAKINSDGTAYQVAKDNYTNERKTFEFAQLKYDQGMISQLEYLGAEMTLKSAELTMMQAGYTYYGDWQKYYALEQGVNLTTYDSI